MQQVRESLSVVIRVRYVDELFHRVVEVRSREMDGSLPSIFSRSFYYDGQAPGFLLVCNIHPGTSLPLLLLH